MVFHIERFRSNIKKTGVLPSNKFEVVLAPPTGISLNYSDSMKELRYRIEEITSPSTTLVTIDTMRYGVGTAQKMPWTAQTNEVGISILADKKSYLWNFWYDWMRYIYEFNPSNAGGASYTSPNYTTRYKNEYATQMQLSVFDHCGNFTSKIDFYDLYPINLKEINFDWNTQNELVKLIVTLTFKEYAMNTSLNQTLSY